MVTSSRKRSLFTLIAVVVALASFEPSASANCTENVNAHFGWIVSSPITSVVFWPPVRSDGEQLMRHWAGLFGTRDFYSRVAEYGVNPGRFGTVVSLSPSAPTGSNISDETIVDYLYVALLSAGRAPDAGEVFLIALPQGTSSAGGGEGHHNWKNLQFQDGNVHPLIYAVVEYDSRQANMDVAASHELFETYTDPIWVTNSTTTASLGWADDSNSYLVSLGRELADMCVAQHYPLVPYWTLNGATLSQIWSQQLCNCH